MNVFLTQARKACIAIVGAGTPVGLAVADPRAETIITAVLAVLVAAGVYRVPNDSPAPSVIVTTGRHEAPNKPVT